MLNFCDFIQVYIFSTNHHLNAFDIPLYPFISNDHYNRISMTLLIRNIIVNSFFLIYVYIYSATQIKQGKIFVKPFEVETQDFLNMEFAFKYGM